MWVRIARRLVAAAATLLLVTGAVFALVHLAPGDAVEEAAEEAGRLPPEILEAFREAYHLDRPPLARYLGWIGDLARGDLGRSFVDRRPVAEKIGDRLPTTLVLNVAALAVMILLAFPLGLASAWRPGSATDRLSAGATLALYSIPAFWAALLLQWVFAIRLGWLPLFGVASPGGGGGLADRAAHLVLPVVCLAYGGIAYLSRFLRGGLLDAASLEVVRGARARGLAPFRAFARHGLRQAAIPMLTLAGFLLPRLVGGSVVIETVFAIPGLGRLTVDAAFARDLPTLLALTLLSGAVTLAGVLLADAGYALSDPRTRRGR